MSRPLKKHALLVCLCIASWLTACQSKVDNIASVLPTAASPAGYSVAGNVTGLLAGSMVTLTQGEDYLVLHQNGAFAFASPVPTGRGYDVRVVAQAQGQHCTVSHGTGLVQNANIVDVNVACVPRAYAVGGLVQGLVRGALQLSLGSDTLWVDASSPAFAFSTPLTYGAPYSIALATPAPGHSCTLAAASGVVQQGNVTTVRVGCNRLYVPSVFAVSGLRPGSQVTLSRGGTVTQGGNGNITSFSDLFDSTNTYALTAPTGHTCLFSNGQTALNVTATAQGQTFPVVCTVNRYTLGGNAQGLTGSDTLVVSLQGVLGGTVVSSNGPYSSVNAVAYGDAYQAVVSNTPLGKTCALSNATGIMPANNLGNVNVTCMANIYAVGGSIAGLPFNSNIAVVDGNRITQAFGSQSSFSLNYTYGQNYNMTLRPSAGLNCTVSNGTGTVTASVNNVALQCQTALTFNTAQPADDALGQNTLNPQSSVAAVTQKGMSYPAGDAAVNSLGQLAVPDSSASRVLIFNAPPTAVFGTSADGLVGQSLFTNGTASSGATRVAYPNAVKFFGNNQLAVVDSGNARVLLYPANTATGAAPLTALGQSSVSAPTSQTCSAAGMGTPRGVAFNGNQMFVSDSLYHRILVWNTVPTSSGMPADFALGQNTLTTCSPGTSATRLWGPAGISCDGNRLYVADANNNRIAIWNSPGALFMNKPMDYVLNVNNNPTSNAAGTSAVGFNGPAAVLSDGQKLYVADGGNSRVLIYNNIPLTGATGASVVLGQTSLTQSGCNALLNGAALCHPQGLALWGTRLVVSDTSNSRVLIYNSL